MKSSLQPPQPTPPRYSSRWSATRVSGRLGTASRVGNQQSACACPRSACACPPLAAHQSCPHTCRYGGAHHRFHAEADGVWGAHHAHRGETRGALQIFPFALRRQRASAHRHALLWSPPLLPQVDPRPVTPYFFSDRSQYIQPELSRRIVAGLRRIGMLDAQGYVTQDPRYTTKVLPCRWRCLPFDAGGLEGGWQGASAAGESSARVALNPVCAESPPLVLEHKLVPNGIALALLQPWKEQLAAVMGRSGLRPETGDHLGRASDWALIGGA
jgi:hypothetical protein